LYRKPPMAPPAGPSEKVLGQRVPFSRQLWAIAAPKFLTDCMSWFYLVGTPVFLADRFGMGLAARGLPLSTIYLVASVGSVAGGALSGLLLKLGWSLNAARKVTLALCAVAVVPVAWAAYTPDYRVAIGLIALAYSAHQAWAATMWTMIPDLFEERITASVAGFVGMTGAVGAIAMFVIFGIIRDAAAAHHDLGNYKAIFLTASVAYPVALGILQVLTPRLIPAQAAEAG
jgi:ACS family hexuronate transporter-like MFS transporter